MCRKMFFLICLASVLGITAPASAAALLASYEPAEVNELTVSTDPGKDPTLVVSWPVQGGVNDVPPATEGDYVLCLDWTNDNTIEIRHDWNDFTFDLAGEDYILVDVYFATESALPEIIGIWDDVFGWVSGVCVPCTINEWYTIPFYVGNLNHMDLDHIFALKFENMAGDEGPIYIDNLRLGTLDDVIRRQISFAGYNWLVKDSGCGTLDPGSNYFSHSEENVWVDVNSYLHLKIAQRCEKWFCSEVILDASPGYGTYAFTIEGRVDLLDPNIVLGLFTWDTDAPHHNYREIDIEFSRWWDANEPNNAQFVVQPWDNPGNRHRFNVDLDDYADQTTTHEFTWRPDRINFRSYYGDSLVPRRANIIESWSYTGDDIPPAGGENARINFWLLPPETASQGAPEPTDGNEAEVVVKNFRYLPITRARIKILPRTLNLASKGRWITCSIRLGKGYRVTDIVPRSVFLEDKIKADWVRTNGKRQVTIAKFSRQKVRRLLASRDRLGRVRLTIKGQLRDGTRFEGTDTIRVINRGKRR